MSPNKLYRGYLRQKTNLICRGHVGSAVAGKLLCCGKHIAASQTLVTFSWLLMSSWLGLDLLGLQLLGLEVVGGGEVGLQVSLHCWQVCELLPTIATLPSGFQK